MANTFLEIKFDDRLLADLEEKVDDAGTTIEQLIPILCAIYIKS